MTHYYQVIMWISSDGEYSKEEMADIVRSPLERYALYKSERIEQIDVYEEKELPERKA